MRANRSFGAKWNEDESQHLEFKKLPQTSENQTPSWLLLQTSITKQKYQVANFNLQPTKVPRGSLYWPMPWHVKEPCGGRSRRVNRAKNIPWTLNPQPTQPPTNSTNDPHLWSTFAAQKPVSAWKGQTFHSWVVQQSFEDCFTQKIHLLNKKEYVGQISFVGFLVFW